MRWLVVLLIGIFLAGCGGEDDDTTLVGRTTGEKQCEPETRESLAESRQRLVDNGIDVISSECGVDGEARPTVCGGDSGTYNVHRIHDANVQDARGLEYIPVAEITLYQRVECPEGEF